MIQGTVQEILRPMLVIARNSPAEEMGLNYQYIGRFAENMRAQATNPKDQAYLDKVIARVSGEAEKAMTAQAKTKEQPVRESRSRRWKRRAATALLCVATVLTLGYIVRSRSSSKQPVPSSHPQVLPASPTQNASATLNLSARHISSSVLEQELRSAGVGIYNVLGDGFCGPRADVVARALTNGNFDPVRDASTLRQLEDNGYETAQLETLCYVGKQNFAHNDSRTDAMKQVYDQASGGTYVGLEYFQWRALKEGVPYLVVQHDESTNTVQVIRFGPLNVNPAKTRGIYRRSNHYLALKLPEAARNQLLNQAFGM